MLLWWMSASVTWRWFCAAVPLEFLWLGMVLPCLSLALVAVIPDSVLWRDMGTAVTSSRLMHCPCIRLRRSSAAELIVSINAFTQVGEIALL